MRKLVSCFLFLCWITTILATSCSNPKYAPTLQRPVEVYQIAYVVQVSSSSQNVAIKAELLRDSLKLPSGTICKYELGSCYDSITQQSYTWQVNRSAPEEVACEDNLYLYTDENGNNYSYDIIILNKEPPVQFLVAENTTSVFFLQLTIQDMLCGKQVWKTDVKDLVVAVDSENFLDAVDFERSLTSTTIYDLQQRDDVYTAMVIKCELYSYSNSQKENFEVINGLVHDSDSTRRKLSQFSGEIAQLKAEMRSLQTDLISKDSELAELKRDLDDVTGLKTAVRRLQRELSRYKNENADLKDSLSKLQDDARSWNCQSCSQGRVYDAAEEDEVSETQTDTGVFPKSFANVLGGYENCADCVLFPHENLFSIIAALFYVTFSIINTLMNYFSLRMVRLQRHKCIFFYTLTQGLTTRYICKSLSLAKKKVDKWLLDIID